MEMYRKTRAEINLNHLEHNIRAIQKAFPKAPFLCPMVKADGYGHGDVQLAKHLEKMGVQSLGVCLLEEAVKLREAGVKAEVLVFLGFDEIGAKKIIELNLTPVVSCWEHIEILEKVATNAVGIHLKFDTGMNRLGFRIEEAQEVYNRLWQNKKIRLKAICTHLFNGDDADQAVGDSATQLRKLHEVAKLFKPFGAFVHALNSAGILNAMLSADKNLPADHPLRLENWGLRPGLMIYGYNTLPSGQKPVELKPVMTLKTEAQVFRKVREGETVSYGARWQANRDAIIAVVTIGYADGFHRMLSNKAEVLFAGKKARVVGTVCMDYLMVDVTDIVAGQDLNSFKGAEIVFFGTAANGEYLSADDQAKKAETIPYEVLTSVSARVPRVYVGGAGV
jgi:alanine racemase